VRVRHHHATEGCVGPVQVTSARPAVTNDRSGCPQREARGESASYSEQKAEPPSRTARSSMKTLLHDFRLAGRLLVKYPTLHHDRDPHDGRRHRPQHGGLLGGGGAAAAAVAGHRGAGADRASLPHRAGDPVRLEFGAALPRRARTHRRRPLRRRELVLRPVQHLVGRASAAADGDGRLGQLLRHARGATSPRAILRRRGGCRARRAPRGGAECDGRADASSAMRATRSARRSSSTGARCRWSGVAAPEFRGVLPVIDPVGWVPLMQMEAIMPEARGGARSPRQQLL
jgi:hypothetical protein